MEADSLLTSITDSITSAVEQVQEQIKEQIEEQVQPQEAAQEEVAAAAPRARRAQKREVPPKDAKTFFRAMATNPKKYGFSPTGDMAILTGDGTIDTTLPLPSYRDTTPEERADYETGIREEIRSVEKEYDESLKNLKEAMNIWKETGITTDAIQVQRDLIRLDAKRSSLRSPLRWVRSFRNIDRRKLILTSKQPDAKIGHPVYSLYNQTIPFNKRVVERQEGEMDVNKAMSSKEDVTVPSEETFIVFSTPLGDEFGVLSPETQVDLTYNGTRYNNILQAYHAERVGQLGNQGLRTSILKTMNPNTIRFMGKSVKGIIENPSSRELLINIATEVAKQDARIIPLLRKTETDPFVYADAKDSILGIGVSVDAKELVMKRDEWKGENLLGQAWEVVRSNLPKEDESVQSGGAVLEKARTLDDVKEERSHVLMGYYRKGKHQA
jgi:predicted NAD-dependent protein-ADP-ribosyltransferase YbiA (DUF1768 family)